MVLAVGAAIEFQRIVGKIMRKGKLWARLSLMFHIGFWLSAFLLFLVTGEAGSPLPENWRELLFWCHVLQWAILSTLCASAICAVFSLRREGKIPISGAASLVLLIFIAYFWMKVGRFSNDVF